MPVVSGKPGSIRYKGRMRAQLKKADAMLNDLLAYNAKLTARVPPVLFLTAPQIATFNGCTAACQVLLHAKN
jgi:hypothetical protein